MVYHSDIEAYLIYQIDNDNSLGFNTDSTSQVMGMWAKGQTEH